MVDIAVAVAAAAIVVAAVTVIVSVARVRSYKKRNVAQLEALRSDYENEKEKVLSCKSHIEELSDTISDYEKRLVEEQELIRKNAFELGKSNEQLAAVRSDYAAAQEKISASRKHIQELSDVVSDYSDRLSKEQALVQEKISELEKSNGQLNSALEDYCREKEKVLAGNKKITELSQSLADCEKRLSEEQALVKEKIAELERRTKELSAATREIESQNEKSAFIASVVNAEPEPNNALAEYKKLLEIDYQEYANKNDSLAEEARAMKQLLDVQSQLELVAHDTQLLGKNIVAIGGAFSSGKSSFMNSFFTQNKITLPVGMDQTTAIASYCLGGEKTEIIGYSYTGGKVLIPEPIFALFSYGREEEFKFNMKRIIDQIVFKTEFVHPFSNICFVDTPGFNPGSNSALDYDTATTAIASAQVLLWCFDVNNGTIHSDELGILQDILDKNPNIKIYIVANRADLKSMEENEEILAQTEMLLQSNFIEYEGINLYTSMEKFDSQPGEYASATRKTPLADFLEANNAPNTQKEEELLAQVRAVFDEYRAADNERIERVQKQLATFNSIEGAFTEISGKKDEIIAYYKARRSKKFKDSGAPDEDDGELDALSDGIAEIRSDLQATLQKDRADIIAAEELCKKFSRCIRKIFGDKEKPAKSGKREKSAEGTRATTQDGEKERTSKKENESGEKARKKFCDKCGAKLTPAHKFCPKCGTPTSL